MSEKQKAILMYLINRSTEASTWRGLVLIVSASGAVLNQDQQELIIACGLFAAGLIGAAFPDAKK